MLRVAFFFNLKGVNDPRRVKNHSLPGPCSSSVGIPVLRGPEVPLWSVASLKISLQGATVTPEGLGVSIGSWDVSLTS